MPGRALTSAVAQVQRLKRSGMVDQVRPTLRGMLRNIPSGTERYSRSNPWSVKLSVWLFSVTVRTTCSGAAVRDFCFDLQRHGHVGAHQSGEMRDHLIGDLAGIAARRA